MSIQPLCWSEQMNTTLGRRINPASEWEEAWKAGMLLPKAAKHFENSLRLIFIGFHLRLRSLSAIRCISRQMETSVAGHKAFAAAL